MGAHEKEVAPSTVIGADIKVTGNIEASADLMVEGKVEGDVRCRSLILGESGMINGNIFSERARISGSLEGSIETGDLAIEATGMIKGEATYARLKVAPGGTVDGNMKCKKANEQKLQLVQPEAAPAAMGPMPAKKIVIG
jgi:cytoskeletal protein CcmA (bactofilin family)